MLGSDKFEAACNAGQQLSIDQVVDLALSIARPASSLAAPARHMPLTAREREVAALVAEGLTNRQIAERLVISERTADNHMANILGKLGFDTRARVAVWAAEHGLIAGKSLTT
jgi:DNA-binding NarL/FixJ family response regulator